MSPPSIDPQRWDKVWPADLDVLRALAEQGDRLDVPRIVDVSFRGPGDALDRLQASASNFGFAIQSRTIDDAGEPWLFLERVQTTDEESIRALTETYLNIERIFGVECDGWGCLAENGIGE